MFRLYKKPSRLKDLVGSGTDVICSIYLLDSHGFPKRALECLYLRTLYRQTRPLERVIDFR